MNRFLVVVLFFGLAVGVGFLAANVWGMPHKSNVAIFRVVMIGFIPIPLPVGFLTSPHFWAGLLFLLSGVLAWAGFKRMTG